MIRGEGFDLEAGTTDFYKDPTYYDFEFKTRKADVRWYGERYVEADGPVLELGIGSGRIAIPAVKNGAEIVGVDQSDTMLARIEHKKEALPKAKRDKLTLAKGDMRDLHLGRTFGLVSCPFNAFMHLYTREDVERTLDSVRRHLEPDGLFCFDVLMPDLEYLMRPPFKRYPGVRFKHPSFGIHYRYSEQSQWDPVTQICQMEFWYTREEDDPPADTPEEFCIQLSHRYFWPQELEALLHYNGFTRLMWYGDFEGGEVRADAESIIVMATPR
jgi:SAM-dependent methyltransferase